MSEQPFGYDDTGGFQLPGAAAAALVYAPVSNFAHTHTGAFAGGIASQQFGQFQQQTSGIAAGAAVSKQSISALRGEIRGLASDFPIGTAAATQYVGIITQLGVTSAGSESKVGALARVMVQLNAATGSVPQVALGFGQLNRQLASLDPGRLRAFADSLTTLVAKGGGSADGIVSMSRAIAPFAQQAGIGETAVLGISSAFTKLGDEGASAATAVGRVLSDISRSVKTGSADIYGYAAAVGMTAQQFRSLYQSNPTGALERVVTSLGQGGGRAAEFLTARGLDGVRAQRALLQLSQSGNLTSQIALSAQGFGSGATATGAHAAFAGLDSSLTRVRSSAGEATAALGGPLAHVLTVVARMANAVVAPVAHALGSRPGQIALDAAMVAGGVGLLGTKTVLGGLARLGPLALGRQMVTSGPVSAVVAGLRGDREFAPGTLLGRAYNPMMAAATAGEPLGTGMMERPNTFLHNLALGINQGAGLNFASGVPRQALLSTLARRGVTVASGAAAGYLHLLRAPFDLAYQDPAKRAFNLTQPGGASRAFGAEFGAAFQARDLGAMRKATTDFVDGVGGAGKAAARVGGAFLVAGKNVTEFSARTAIGAGRAFAGSAAGRAIGGMVTSPMALLAAGYGAYHFLYQGNQHQNAQFNISNQDLGGELNALRDKMGLAGDATQTFADQAKSAAAALGAIPSPARYAQARTLTAAQIASVQNADSKMTRTTFRGTASQIAQQVSQMGGVTGLTPSDLAAVGTELYRQGFSQDKVDAILAQVNVHQGRLTMGNIAAALVPASAAQRGYSPSTGERLRSGQARSFQNHVAGEDVGINGNPIEMPKTAKAMIDRLIKQMGTQYQRDAQAGGVLYAEQMKLRTANDIMAQANATGNPDLIAYTGKQLSNALTGHTMSLGANELHAHGNFVGYLSSRGAKFANQTLGQLQGKGVALSGQGVGMDVQPYADAAIINSTHRGGVAAVALTDQTGRQGQAIAYLQAHPEDTQALTKAQRLSLAGMRAAGASWQDIANSSSRVAANVSDQDSTTYKLAKSLQQYAQSQQADLDRYKAPGATVRHQFGQLVSLTQEQGPGAAADIASGQQGLRDLRSSLADQYRARLMAQFSYELSVHRATQDFNRQEARAQQDYQRQVLYTEQDFYRTRYRTLRDYNIQVQREIQDAAQSMYDPYTRIPVEPIWDAGNLIQNEQLGVTAMRQQLQNIRKLRELGLDEQAIRQLRLYDPTKAQQVQQLVDDLSNRPGEVHQLDSLAAKRQTLAGGLTRQDPQFIRQRQDLNRQLGDMHADFTRGLDRMASEYQTSLERAGEDQHRALDRMAQDLHNADLQITGDFQSLQSDMIKILNGQQVHWSDTLVNGLNSTINTVEKLGPRWTHAFNKLDPTTTTGAAAAAGPAGAPGTRRYDPNAATFSDSSGISYAPTKAETRANNPAANLVTGKAMAGKVGWTGGQWSALRTLWNNESGWDATVVNGASGAYGIPQGIPSIHPDYAAVMHGGAAQQIAWGIGYIKGSYGDPAKALAFWNRTDPRSKPGAPADAPKYPGHWYAAGGIATREHIGVVAEDHRPEAMIPLDSRGAKFMAAALREYGGDELRVLAGGGRAASVVIHASYHYDQRNDFTGAEIVVQAQDPNEMGRKLEQKTAQDNLTATRGVNWSRSR